jgi:hypothetical protein
MDICCHFFEGIGMNKFKSFATSLISATLIAAPMVGHAQTAPEPTQNTPVAPEKECKQNSDNAEERCKPGAIIATSQATGGVSLSTIAAIAAAIAVAAAAAGGSSSTTQSGGTPNN